MLLTPEDLQRIAARTLAHYDQNAQAYWDGTRDHDVRQNIDALLQSIEAKPPFSLLDLGCGPGRDLKTFKALGHRVTGLEGSAQLAALARTNSGCDVLEQNFLELDLPQGHFDGVFANAVLFHIPSQVLPRILRQLRTALKAGGVLFSSNPRGDGQEGWNGDRYGAFYDWPAWRSHVRHPGSTPLIGSELLGSDVEAWVVGFSVGPGTPDDAQPRVGRAAPGPNGEPISERLRP